MIFSTSIFASNIEARYVPSTIVITIYAKETAVIDKVDHRNFGHSYITIENIGGESLNFGTYYIGPNKGISIGTWNEAREHIGMYFNRELKLQEDGYYSYSRTITQTQLNEVEKYVFDSRNNDWSYVKTCTDFAIDAWNCSGAPAFSKTHFPKLLVSQIQNKSGYQYSSNITQNYPVQYMSNNGVISTSKFN